MRLNLALDTGGYFCVSVQNTKGNTDPRLRKTLDIFDKSGAADIIRVGEAPRESGEPQQVSAEFTDSMFSGSWCKRS